MAALVVPFLDFENAAVKSPSQTRAGGETGEQLTPLANRAEPAQESSPGELPAPAAPELATVERKINQRVTQWEGHFQPALASLNPANATGKHVKLVLPSGESLVLEIENATAPAPRKAVFTGKLAGGEHGSFSLAVVNGQSSGAIRRYHAHSAILVRPGTKGMTIFDEIDAESFGVCGTCAAQMQAQRPPLPQAAPLKLP